MRELWNHELDANAREAVLPSNITSNDKCSLTVHPKVGLRVCPYSHVINAKISQGKMVRRKCPTSMVIFIPLDISIQKAIVFLRGPHNHPMHPKTKPSSEEKVQLHKAIEAAGRRGLTVQKLLNAPSTSTIYNGKSIPEASPAFMDRRRLRDEIHASKMKDYPKGMGWEGDIDEWEIVGFLERFKRRVTLARFYCDRNTRNAFGRLFSELFRLIPELTGSILKFFAFFPDDPSALLRAIILDAEAAQAQGLGDELLVYVAKNVPETVKTLSSTVPRDTIERLKGFVGLKTEEEIVEWHNFCHNSPDKSVRDWNQQKMNYAWLLPSLNRFLSKMDNKSWDMTPIHSNLVEGGHSGTNAVTSIGQEIGEAVNSARDLDEKVVNELEAMEKNGVLPKRWNGPNEREHLSEQRRAWSHEKKKTHQERLSQYDILEAELDTVSLRQTESLNVDKALQEQIKVLRSDQGVNSKEKIKALQKQVETEKEKRRALKTRRQEIKKDIQELKDSGLNGSRINGRRPTLPSSRIKTFLGDSAEAPVSPFDLNSASGLDHHNIPISQNEISEMAASSTSLVINIWFRHIEIIFNPFTEGTSAGDSLAPKEQPASHFDPNGPGMGLDFNFSNLDFGIDFTSNFNFDEAFIEAALSLGPRETANTSPLLPSYSNPFDDPRQFRATNLAEAGGSDITKFSLPPPVMTSNPIADSPDFNHEARAHKRKKVDEVNEADILPEGSRRNRNRSARARGFDLS
ncbi:hypothetical protein BDZ97DRAFT_1909987 [Flammula alnicola]|nr:hypothetical protein BDZ97DRAFT_1909987 [Flammula alnicola]